MGDESGISQLTLGDKKPQSEVIPAALAPVSRQLDAYFRGDLTQFDIAVRPEGTAFQKKVWKALMEIPFGNTISYRDLAAELGNPGAVRAVASANAQNPIWILIPCHRVVGSDGALRGYAGGLHRKKWLLDHENGSCQYSLFPGKQTARSDL